jgi:hypothetical protein
MNNGEEFNKWNSIAGSIGFNDPETLKMLTVIYETNLFVLPELRIELISDNLWDISLKEKQQDVEIYRKVKKWLWKFQKKRQELSIWSKEKVFIQQKQTKIKRNISEIVCEIWSNSVNRIWFG